MSGTLHVYADLVQGSDEWLAARRGIVTASTVGQLITTTAPSGLTVTCPECGAEAGSPCVSLSRRDRPAIKTLHGSRTPTADAPHIVQPADIDATHPLALLLAAERINGWTEDTYVSHDMLRGTLDEPVARDVYTKHHATVTECGFMVREQDGRRLGYSPDGLVGDDGLIEIKSRRAKAQLATVLDDDVPAANMAQLQAGLLVSGRAWIDYVSFSGGMPLWRKRVEPDEQWFDAIREAVALLERTVEQMVATYTERTAGLPATERSAYDMDLVI